ncbi:MAG: RNB domain-containing ribonuclease [Chloroflexi bacterium]|nr:RNB domain-containing ribonuclease [Chloroflexota bacterium]MBP8057070.1 RNB domain-containing ribonuclease [Chloroflexota bacterium]
METSPLNRDALVVYKNRPARVRDNDKKLELELDGGESVKVRPKDVQFLHPGPVRQLPPPRPTDGDILSAWELLAGEITTLPELADLAYGTYTPATAWAIWELLADGLHFSGTPEAIVAHSATVVAEKATVREAKAAAERAWHAFLHRLEQGHYDPSDRSYLEDVEALALEKREQSRILRALNRVETPQNAHALLLSIGYWKATTNPYPTRLGIPLTPPNLTLPPLPEEPRRDLTHLEAWAIDDEGSQDPDDALSWDGERLWVHIADAAALVTPTSPADQEARGRAFNLYLPDGTIPMLPPDATHRLALGLNEVSPALSFALQVNATGEVTLQEMAISWVRVQRISYEEAQNRLDQSPFREMVTYIQPFHARRLRQGAIEIDLPEVRIRVKEGQVVIRRLLNLPSRDLVREAMLMTGEAVARYAQERHISLPFATQDPPDEDAPLAAATPSAYFALRRSLKRGQPKIAAAPHAGLGLTQYVQTTSPLRRYLDTVVHQQLRAHLTGQPLLNEQAILERIGSADAVSGTMRQAERLSNQHWTLVYLQQNPDWQGEGVIIEKRGSRDLVLFPDLAWESELYLKKDLPLDTYLTFTCTGLNLPEREAFFRLR